MDKAKPALDLEIRVRVYGPETSPVKGFFEATGVINATTGGTGWSVGVQKYARSSEMATAFVLEEMASELKKKAVPQYG